MRRMDTSCCVRIMYALAGMSVLAVPSVALLPLASPGETLGQPLRNGCSARPFSLAVTATVSRLSVAEVRIHYSPSRRQTTEDHCSTRGGCSCLSSLL